MINETNDALPILSILIPTKNRISLLNGALKSLELSLDHHIEVIIVDNSDEPIKEKIDFVYLEKYRYLRTGNLDMPNNWEHALNFASGEYITVFPDKNRFYTKELDLLLSILKNDRVQVLSWQWDIFNGKEKCRPAVQTSRKSIPSEELLLNYVSALLSDGESLLPRTLNSAVQRKLILQAKMKSKDEIFFDFISPDFVAAFKILAITKSVHFLPVSVGYVDLASNESSSSYHRKTGDHSYYGGETLDQIKLLTKNKSKLLTYNCVYHDFLNTKNDFPELKRYSMSKIKYAAMCQWEILKLIKARRSKSIVLKEIVTSLRSEGLVVSCTAFVTVLLKTLWRLRLHGKRS